MCLVFKFREAKLTLAKDEGSKVNFFQFDLGLFVHGCEARNENGPRIKVTLDGAARRHWPTRSARSALKFA